MTAVYILVGVYVFTAIIFVISTVTMIGIERRENERHTERMTRELREENKDLVDRVMYLSGRTWKFPSDRGEPILPRPEEVHMEYGPEMTDAK